MYPDVTAGKSGFEIHGQAMMVIHMFLDTRAYDEKMKYAARSVFKEISGSDVASFVQVESGGTTGLGMAGEKMTTMLAYSVIESGGMPFGNTGIRAIQNDISDLSGFLGINYAQYNYEWVFGSPISDHFGIDGFAAMSKFAITFAADMAKREIVTYSDDVKRSGVLSFNYGSNSMTLDLSTTTWGKDVDPSSVPGASIIVARIESAVMDMDDGIIDALDSVYAGSGIMDLSDLDSYGLSYGGTAAIVGISAHAGVGIFLSKGDGLTILGSRNYVFGDAKPTDDVLVGTDGDDFIRGMDGRDVLIGGKGNDNLEGGYGNDALLGGEGDDRLAARGLTSLDAQGRTEHDIWDGGDGNDELSFEASYWATGVVLNLSDDERLVRSSGSSEDVLIAAHSGKAGTLTADVVDIEVVRGTYAGDVFVGAGNSTLFGGYGNDVFYVGAGDLAYGGDDDDVFYITPGARVFGGGGRDSYHFDLGTITGPIDLQIEDYASNEWVFLKWQDKEVRLNLGLPQKDYYSPVAPSITVNRQGDVVTVAEHGSGEGKVTTYLPDGSSIVVTNDSTGVFGIGWGSDPTFFGKHAQVIANGVGNLMPYHVGNPFLQSMLRGADAIGQVHILTTQTMMAFGPLNGMMHERVYDGEWYDRTYDMDMATRSWVVPQTDGQVAQSVYEFIDPYASVGTFMYGPSGFQKDGFSTMASGEVMISGSGGDLLIAGNGTGIHNLSSGAGDDVLVGGTGNDVLNGGDGRDLFITGAGSNTVIGGLGWDTLSYSGLDVGVNIHVGGAGGTATGVGFSDSFSGVEFVVGTREADHFTGGSRGIVMVGGAGNDVFDMTTGAIAYGGSGADVYDIVPGSEVLIVSLDHDDVIKVGGVVLKGLSYDTTYRRLDGPSDGDYDIIERIEVSGSFASGVRETIVKRHYGAQNADVRMEEVLSDGISIDNRMELSGNRAKITVNGATIYIGDFQDGDSGLRYEHLLERIESPYHENGFHRPEVSTQFVTNGYAGADQFPHISPLETQQAVLSDFWLI